MFYLLKVNVLQFLDYCLDDGRVRISILGGGMDLRILYCAKTSRRVLSNSYRTFFAREQCDRNMQLTSYMHLAATLGIRLAIPPLFHTSFWQGS